MNDNKHTFKRYEEGADHNDWDLEDKIFQQDTTYKCPTYVHKTAPCSGSCPSGHDIRGWLAIARGMDKPPVEGQAWQEYAFHKMTEANPFPASMGRVCPAPCESGCNRNEVDDYVGINAVEQYVGDWANENGVKLVEAGADTGFKIAVIGGGPAGLAAAYFMRQDGHAVTVFEANGKLGGMMRYGIPGYRTPRDMLDIEIGRITEMGVDVKLNTKVGVDVSVASLEEEYDAIFWALGAQKGRPLPIPGWEGTENCIDGVEFLDAFNKGWVVGTAQKVVVVGGGDTSIDVASVARRLGHVTNVAKTEHSDGSVIDFTAQDAAGVLTREGMQATLTSLFPIEQMTAAEHEREDAKREGVDIKGSVMPLEVILNAEGRATGLKMCECVMKGNAPEIIEGTEFVIEADIIIAAIGQAGDFEGIDDLGNERGFIEIEAGYKVKGKDKHFAGGDILKPHLLTTAIGHGRVAAETITDFLDDGIISKRPKIDIASFNLLEELNERGHAPTEFGHDGELRGTDSATYAVHNYEDRSDGQIVKHTELYKGHFPYVARGIRDEVHIEGDNCVIYCPQDAVARVKKNDRTLGRYVETDYSKCIGCHICADVCPTGYIQMGLGG